ncbi:MAG: YhcH/YjgK/YiaL family protein [Bacteroidota bacterium]
MIIDTIANARKYFSVHPLFQKAFEYIGKTDLNSIEMGKYEIDGENLKAVFSNKKGMSADASVAKFECHNKHIDIQLCIDGVETFGWKPREKCLVPNGDYNETKDTQLYTDTPDMYFQLTNKQFAILFPEDVHAPMIGTDEIKKVVIKVKLEIGHWV